VSCAAAVLVTSAGLVTAGSLSQAAAAKVYDGPDVASYQHPHTKQHPNGQPINWKAVRKSGKEFAIIKATEGTDYTNPNFAGPTYNDYAAAGRAGLVRGAYHFARPSLPIVSSAVAQAKYFAAVVGPVSSKATLPPALDLEVTGGLHRGQLVTWAQTFLLEMRRLTGRTPMLYTYPTFWTSDLGDPTALARYPLWMAAYGTSRAPISDLWQYTSTAHVKGIAGDVDVSKFVGTSGFPWKTLSNGTVHTPWGSAPPGAPVTPKATIDGTTATVSWLPGDAGTSRITSYQVKASPGGAVETVGGSHFTASFEKLSPKTSYTFTVTAINANGRGLRSIRSNPVMPVIPTELSATVKPSTITYGAELPIKVKLTRSDTAAALVNKPVLVFRRNPGSAHWKQIRAVRTNASGHASVVLHPSHSARIEAVFAGATGVARSQVFTRYVVRPAVTAALSETSVAAGTPVTFSGTTSPFVAGQKVTREILTDGVWQKQASTTVDQQGQFSFTLHPKLAGEEILRALVLHSALRSSGHSHRVDLTVS
jgi:GH25 family lysozyme M1 (1,4-beta-N-acetylmuramidase)